MHFVTFQTFKSVYMMIEAAFGFPFSLTAENPATQELSPPPPQIVATWEGSGGLSHSLQNILHEIGGRGGLSHCVAA